MDKFKFIINEQCIAEQIAALLNTHNKLKVIHTKHTILTSNITYLVKEKYINGLPSIVGCVGIDSTDSHITTLRHLCVDLNQRRTGIGLELLNNALTYVNTKYVQMHIRHDNTPSVYLASKLGFLVDTYDIKNGYFILTVKKEAHAETYKIH